jgi:hypothetical protein
MPPFERIQRDIGRMPSERQVDVSPFPIGIPSSQPPPPSSPPPMILTPTGSPNKKGDN